MQLEFPAHRALWISDDRPLANTYTEQTIFDPAANLNWSDRTAFWTKTQLESFMRVLFSSDELVTALFDITVARQWPKEERHLLMFAVNSDGLWLNYKPAYDARDSTGSFLDGNQPQEFYPENIPDAIERLKSVWDGIPENQSFDTHSIFFANSYAKLAFQFARGDTVIRLDGTDTTISIPDFIEDRNSFNSPPILVIENGHARCIVQAPNTDRQRLYQLHNYGANVLNFVQNNPHMYCDGKNPSVIYGVELELSTDYSIRDLVDAQEQVFAFYKADSTVTGSKSERYEMVTIPMSLKSHRIAWAKWFKSLQDDEFDITTGTNNGLHIHLSREAFQSSHHQDLFTWFFCHPAHKDFLHTVSERTIDSFSNNAPVPHIFDSLSQKEFMKAIKPHVQETRGVIGWGRGKPTVEVRMFKGIVSYSAIMKGLEFVDAVLNFTAEQKKLEHTTILTFLEWLENTPSNRYRFLKTFLKKTNLSKAKRSYEMFSLLGPDKIKSTFDADDVELINSKLPNVSEWDAMIVREKLARMGRRHSEDVSFVNGAIAVTGRTTTILKDLDQEAIDTYSREVA